MAQLHEDQNNFVIAINGFPKGTSWIDVKDTLRYVIGENPGQVHFKSMPGQDRKQTAFCRIKGESKARSAFDFFAGLLWKGYYALEAILFLTQQPGNISILQMISELPASSSNLSRANLASSIWLDSTESWNGILPNAIPIQQFSLMGPVMIVRHPREPLHLPKWAHNGSERHAVLDSQLASAAVVGHPYVINPVEQPLIRPGATYTFPPMTHKTPKTLPRVQDYSSFPPTTYGAPIAPPCPQSCGSFPPSQVPYYQTRAKRSIHANVDGSPINISHSAPQDAESLLPTKGQIDAGQANKENAPGTFQLEQEAPEVIQKCSETTKYISMNIKVREDRSAICTYGSSGKGMKRSATAPPAPIIADGSFPELLPDDGDTLPEI